MYNSDTEVLFPSRAIPSLRDLRGESWRLVVERAWRSEPAGLDRLAFVLLMVRLNNCSACRADSFRALRGCTICASQTVRRFRGNDEELVGLFTQAHQDVGQYLEGLHV